MNDSTLNNVYCKSVAILNLATLDLHAQLMMNILGNSRESSFHRYRPTVNLLHEKP